MEATTSRKRKRGNNVTASTSTSLTHTFALTDFLSPPPDAPLISYVERVSADNRRTYSTAIPVPSYIAHPSNERYVGDFVHEDQLHGEEMGGDAQGDAARRRETTSSSQDAAMSDWARSQRDLFLQRLLWHDGRAPYTGSRNGPAPTLPGAPSPTAGSRVQVGHRDGTVCSRPSPARDDFVVLERNGIHNVRLDYCGCYHTTEPDYVQLLDVGWYPATCTTPRTCATFQCLDAFQAHSHHGKTTAYDYYAALETFTNAVGVKPPDRYKMLLRMSRQYRHLLLLKRGGRGYDEFGVNGTGRAGVVILCNPP
ncbi:CxC2 domain-containing protein [Mycena kentingensis (nom. inval.)]|nr:CxC2 domain-containing protein [Mycena kentingensis (nom. inval.)]